MRAIFLREVGAYFTTMIGYAFLAVFLLLSGLFFSLVNIAGGDGSMASMIGSFASLLFLMIPILTMRLMSEDRRQKTDQLLLTAPVSRTQIVLGKFFAAWFVYFAATAVTFLYLIILYLYGTPYLPEILLAYLGLWLLGGAMIAVGQFISSLTEHQFIAALLTICVLLFFQSVDSLINMLRSEFLSRVMDFFAPLSRFQDFILGIFSFSSLAYFLLLMGLFLFLTVQTLNKRR